MLPKGRQGVAMWLITGLSEKMLILSVLVKSVDGTEGKEVTVSYRHLWWFILFWGSNQSS